MKLIDAAAAFPTVILTILLGIVLVYWLFVILGALDLDLFSGDADIGGGDGIGIPKGIDIGGADGIGIPKGGIDIGGAEGVGIPKGVEIGVPKGVGIPKGGADFDVDMGDGSHMAKSGGLVNLLRPLGLSRVPLTISLTFVILSAWTFCLLIIHYLTQAWPDGSPWVIGAIGFVGSLVLSIPMTSLLITPLGPMFHTEPGKTRADYLGSVCEITTGHVDGGFGQAKIEDGGNVLVIPVRCDSGKQFKRYGKALVIDYDDDRNAYLVEPMDDAELDSASNA